MLRDDFIKENPIDVVMETRGVKFTTKGNQRKAVCPFHKDKNPSLSVNVRQGVWNCLAGCGRGSVIDFIMLDEGLTFQAFAEKYNVGEPPAKAPMREKPKSIFGNRKLLRPFSKEKRDRERDDIEAIYSYQDKYGKEVYQSVRLIPKDFRQRRRVGNDWIWNLQGVERVLYNLPAVMRAQEVWCTEGEKDVATLNDLKFTATTSCGGANGWLDAYSDSLAGKDVVLCGDNDEAGETYIQAIFDSVEGKAKSVKKIKLPKHIKDVTDYVATYKNTDDARASLCEFRDLAYPFVQGRKILIKSMEDAEAEYTKFVQHLGNHTFQLGMWIPVLADMRPLVPGDLVTIIGSTSAGKTAVVSSIIISARPLPTIFFEFELPTPMLFERLTAARFKSKCIEIEEAYKSGLGAGRDVIKDNFKNLFICTESNMTLEMIEEQIYYSELVIGEKPKVGVIDYLQLAKGKGPRRERFSDFIEGCRVMANKLQIILFVTSQIGRPGEEQEEVTLFDAKETGSIENSSSLMLGIWRDTDDETLLHGRVLKNTRGKPGRKFKMTIDGERMLITPRIANINDPVDTTRKYDSGKDKASKVKDNRYGEKDET